MNTLPKDMYHIITSFLSLPELIHAMNSHKDFNILQIKRKTRFEWCKRKIDIQRRIMDGKCAHDNCTHQKTVCYHMEPLVTQVLSPYCSRHTLQLLQFNAVDLL